MRKIMKYKLKLDYTADELKELKRFNTDYHSPMNAIKQIADIGNNSDKLKNLQIKYAGIDYEDEFNFMADVNNVVMGTAIFPEKKYYVKLIRNNDSSYLYRSKLTNFLILGGCSLSQDYQTEFTEQEIKNIDPRYMAFAIPVEEG